MKIENQSDFYDLPAEDSALASAASDPGFARTPAFHTGLFSEERMELAKRIKTLAFDNAAITRKNLDAAGAPDGVSQAFDLALSSNPAPPSGKAIRPIVDRLRTLSMRRVVHARIVRIHGELPSLESAEVVERAKDLMVKAQRVQDATSTEDMEDGSDISELIDDLERRCENPGALNGIRTGREKLDHALDGLQGGRLVIVAGKPHAGKTTVGLELTRGILTEPNQGDCLVATVSAEMTAKQLKQGMLEITSGTTLKPGAIPTKGELARIQSGMKEMSGFNWKIADPDRPTIDYVCNKVRALKMQNSTLKVVVVDYIQILNGSEFTDDMRQIVNEITGKLKALSKELDICVIAMSQLNRGTSKLDPQTGRTIYGRPSMGGLKESSSIESDADVVILIHRELEAEADDEKIVSLDLIIAKNRQTGLCGDIPCSFNKDTRRVTEQSHLVRFI